MHGGHIDFPATLREHALMRLRLSQWLPVLLLVLCQTALLIHQSDIDAHAHGENCSVCLLVHGLDNALPTRFVIHIDKPVAPVFVAGQQSGCIPQTRSFYLTRAPPSITHPIV